MSPATILVMRHAEKPDDPTDPDLSADGKERARKLAVYIPHTFWTPDFIVASALSKHSARPYETVKPLSKAVGIPIDATFADQDYEALAHELLKQSRYDRKRVLVCWHHGHIPSLMSALGAKAGDYPDPWDPRVFNLILLLDSGADGSATVAQVQEPF